MGLGFTTAFENGNEALKCSIYRTVSTYHLKLTRALSMGWFHHDFWNEYKIALLDTRKNI